MLDEFVLDIHRHEVAGTGRNESQNVDNLQACAAASSEVSRMRQGWLFISQGINVYEHARQRHHAPSMRQRLDSTASDQRRPSTA
jgi:hypothetical protein